MITLRSALLLIGLCLFFMVDDVLLLLFVDQLTPLHTTRPVIVGAIAAVCAISVVIGWLVFRAMQRKPATGKEGLVGERGRALTPLNPRGQVLVHGEIWQAAANRPVKEGEEVQVVRVDGLIVQVK